jgi:uncharacterized membrane protein YcaP (DUF421 family)
MINSIFLTAIWFVFLFVAFKIITKDTKKSVVIVGTIALVTLGREVLGNQFSIHIPKYVYNMAIVLLLLIVVSFFKSLDRLLFLCLLLIF